MKPYIPRVDATVQYTITIKQFFDYVNERRRVSYLGG